MGKSDKPHFLEKSSADALANQEGQSAKGESFAEDGQQQPSILISRQLQPRLLFKNQFPLRRKDGFQPIPLPPPKTFSAYSILAGGLQKLIAQLLGTDKSSISIEFGLQEMEDGLNARTAFQLSLEGWDELSENMKMLVSQACFDFIHVLELKADELPETKPSDPSVSTESGQQQATNKAATTAVDTGLFSAPGDLNHHSLSVATEFRKLVGPLSLGSGSQIVAGTSSQSIPAKTEGAPPREEATERIEFSGKQVAFANYNARVCCLHNKGGTGILEIGFDIEKYLADLLEAEKKRWLVAGTYEKKTFKNGSVEMKLVGKLSIQITCDEAFSSST